MEENVDWGKYTFCVVPVEGFPLGPGLGHDAVEGVAHVGADILSRPAMSCQ